MTPKSLEEEVAIVDEWLRTYACFQDGIDDVDFILRLIADWRARGERIKEVWQVMSLTEEALRNASVMTDDLGRVHDALKRELSK